MRVERWSLNGLLTGAVAGFFAILLNDEFLTGLIVGVIWLFLIPGVCAAAAIFFDFVVLDQTDSATKRVREHHFSPKQFELYSLTQYEELEKVLARKDGKELEKISGQIARKIGRNSPPVDPQSFLMSYYIQFRAYLLATGKL